MEKKQHRAPKNEKKENYLTGRKVFEPNTQSLAQKGCYFVHANLSTQMYIDTYIGV